jgi:hypothetical protein
VRTAPSSEIDVDTRPRPEKPAARAEKATTRKLSVRRVIAIGAAAFLVLCAAIAVPVFSGVKVPPCSSAFANQLSVESNGADVRAIWWAYAPDVVTGPIGVVCGVATDNLDVYVLDEASLTAITGLLGDDWECARYGGRDYRCAEKSTRAYLLIYDHFPSRFSSLTPGVTSTSVYVEVHKPR